MKLNIEGLAREAGFKSRNGLIRVQHSNGSFVVIDEEIEAFARLIVERCAVTVESLDCAHRCGVGTETATAIRKLLEDE